MFCCLNCVTLFWNEFFIGSHMLVALFILDLITALLLSKLIFNMLISFRDDTL
jgi:hypothetical protein